MRLPLRFALGSLVIACSSNGSPGSDANATSSSGSETGTTAAQASGGGQGVGGARTSSTSAVTGSGGSAATLDSVGGAPSASTGNATSSSPTGATNTSTETTTTNTSSSGGATASTGSVSSGNGGTSAAGGTTSSCSGPVGSFDGELATGIAFMDTDGERVNAHGGGIIRVGDTYYLHGEYFSSTETDNDFRGFSMYSSQDLAIWKNEGIILPQQPSGELGPNRKGERPHIIQCPDTGEFVLFAHAASADYQTDKEIVYATSATVNATYQYQGPLTNSGGQIAAHSDMSAYADESGAYMLTESGHVYTLSSDCHSWVSDQSFSATNGDSGGAESPTVFKADGTYYWIGSYKTGWRANNNFYSTAPSITGPWTYQGYLAPVADPNDNISDERTWLSQSTWVQPVEGCQGTVYVYWGDHWDGTQDTTAPGRHNYLATYVFQPLVFDGSKISLPRYLAHWTLDVGAGTWSE